MPHDEPIPSAFAGQTLDEDGLLALAWLGIITHRNGAFALA